MPKTVQLSELRSGSRQRADMVNSAFVTDSELDGFINSAKDELWDLIVQSGQDYGITTELFTLSGTNTHTLPADYYKTRGVDDLQDASNPIEVRAFNFQERNYYSRNEYYQRVYRYSKVTYRVIGNTLYFVPKENADGDYRHWYYPVIPDLVSPSDTLDVYNGWHEYIMVCAAIRMLRKEESSTSGFEREKEELKKRILSMSNERDMGQPEKIARTRKLRFRDRLVWPF